jgi:uncharacterized zinc-type alcohol dehydrogenase-like protein
MAAIRALAAAAAKTPLAPIEYDPGELGVYDVEIKITHCGVCHSDLHLVDGDWNQEFPKVPGHEIIGTVTRAGAAVDAALIGRRAGVGWQRGACMACEWCLHGEENICPDSVATCDDGNYGGFAERIQIDSRFVHVIPDGMDSVNAAPLLCAGITVYEPLRRFEANATTRVGVVGIGGLGHMALQFADKLGCHVTAFSSSDAKRDEAQQLGADDYINTSDAANLKQARRSQDLVIVTATANLDWKNYVRVLRPNGILCFVSAPDAPLSVPIGWLMGDHRSVTGSSIGGRARMREMLAFAAQHNITAWTETLPFDSVNTALERLRNNDVRYRFVLEW